MIYFIFVSNHTVKKIGGDSSFFIFKIKPFLRMSAAPHRLGYVATITGVVAWKFKKQTISAWSMMELEMIALVIVSE